MNTIEVAILSLLVIAGAGVLGGAISDAATALSGQVTAAVPTAAP